MGQGAGGGGGGGGADRIILEACGQLKSAVATVYTNNTFKI